MYTLPLVLLISGLLALEVQFVNGGSVSVGTPLMLLAALSSIVLIFLTRRRGEQIGINFKFPDLIYLVYLAYCSLSAAWSPSPNKTLLQVFILLVTWLSCTIAGKVTPELIARYVVRSAFILAIISLIMMVATPGLAYQPRTSTNWPELRGIFVHQLRLGAYMSIALMFMAIAWTNRSFGFVVSRHPIYAPLIVVTVFLVMVLALARTYTAYAILALPISYFLSKRGLLRWSTVLALLGIAAFIMTHADTVVSDIGEGAGDVTFSGRARIWEISYFLYEKGSPLWGYGYSSYNLPQFDFVWKGNYRPPHPHNSFIQALFETGLVGALLVGAFIIAQIISAVRSSHSI